MEATNYVQPIMGTTPEEARPGLSRTESRATASACRLHNVLSVFRNGSDKPSRQRHSRVPPISALRLADAREESDKSKTKLYLAYGSNLCYETFQGRRGIRPLGHLNVVVPTLRMTFDLPGIPYVEPCFANSATRDPNNPPTKNEYSSEEYNKDKWKKGMVGVVYEVTPEDYVEIINTEGGGVSYEDILVQCFPLALGEGEVPEFPQSQGFMAHTLFAPAVPPDDPEHHGGRFTRPDPSYAQPSARYLKLITDGGAEHSLPQEYMDYLVQIRPYEARSWKTKTGAVVFQTFWLPFMMFFFALTKAFKDKNGNVPVWVAKLGTMIFGAVWMSYDGIFKPIFGDGERTDYSKKSASDRRQSARSRRLVDDSEYTHA